MAFVFKHGDRPLSGYTIQRAIGRGGFGEVYYAVSDGGREVALKYLRENPEIELRGVSHCINLKSPHLVTIFDVRKNEEGEYFIIMEYVSGPSLRDLLVAEPDGLGVEKAAFFLREIVKGLAYLHGRGIVHRDLKPGNIFYDDGYVKIGDYGLSKFISASRHSAQTASVGTVHYMAPEIGSGDYSRGIDIYALGVIVYEMLSGKVPYDGGSAGEVLMKHLTAQPCVDQLPEPFPHVVSKALAKDPNERYRTVDEMVEDVFDMSDVKQSVAGFNPTSLTQAAAYAAAAGTASPRPAPKPPPPPPTPGPQAPPRAVPVGGAPYATPVADRTRQLTPEAEYGHLQYAGFWIRVGAALIDALIVGSVSSAFGPFGIGPFGALIGVVYEAVLIANWNGQTIGKKLVGIKVISKDGRPVEIGQAFIRSFSEILSTLAFGLGHLWVAFDPKKRAWHDHIAGTLHVHAIQ